MMERSVYDRLINYLIPHAASPHGLVGKIITKIWSKYFTDLYEWGYRQIDLAYKMDVLDIGFGGGSGIKYLMDLDNKHTIYGVDVSKEAVKTATRLNRIYIDNGSVSLSVGSATNLLFDNDFFDLVVAVQSHIYWDGLDKGLVECYRVLKNKGILLIVCELDKIDYHLPEYKEPSDFIEMLQQIGFNDVHIASNKKYIAYIAIK